MYGDHQATGDPLYGSEIWLSEDAEGIDETRPSVACNIDAHSCLVTFEYHAACPALGAAAFHGGRKDRTADAPTRVAHDLAAEHQAVQAAMG